MRVCRRRTCRFRVHTDVACAARCRRLLFDVHATERKSSTTHCSVTCERSLISSSSCCMSWMVSSRSAMSRCERSVFASTSRNAVTIAFRCSTYATPSTQQQRTCRRRGRAYGRSESRSERAARAVGVERRRQHRRRVPLHQLSHTRENRDSYAKSESIIAIRCSLVIRMIIVVLVVGYLRTSSRRAASRSCVTYTPHSTNSSVLQPVVVEFNSDAAKNEHRDKPIS